MLWRPTRRGLIRAGGLIAAPAIIGRAIAQSGQFPPGVLLSRGPLDPAAGGGNVFATYALQDTPAIQNSPGSSTVTFTGVAIGTAASNRVVVALFNSAVQIASACTIGGVSATLAIGEATVASSVQIWYATVPSGTTANFVFSFPGNPTNCCLVSGSFNSGASTTPTDTEHGANASGSSQTLNTIIPSSGFGVMAVAMSFTGVSGAAWTNMTSSAGDSSQTATLDTLVTAHSTTAGSPTALSWSNGFVGAIHSVSASWGP